MRTDLILNYAVLEYTSDQITAYSNAMEAMEQALEGLKEVLKNQESDAVETLSDKLETASTNMDYKKETLRQLKSILDRYIDGMEKLVGAENRNEKTRADQYDIWYNINQIESPVNRLERGVASAAWGSSSWIPVKEEDYMRNIREKEERNYTKLEGMRSSKLVGLASNLKKYVTDIWDIYNDYIKPFENLDDDYRKELNSIYRARTSDADKRSNFWDSFKSIGGSFLKAFAIAFVGAFLVALAPGWLIVGTLAVLAVGCVIMANVPEESVPDWLKKAKQTADAVADKAVQVLEEGPMVLVEDIGQGFMDQIQTPEGIAAVAGETIGGFAGGFAGTKLKAKIKAKGANVEKAPDVEEPITSKETDFEIDPFDQNGNLKKNIKYKTGEFDYTYQTDSSGRIVKFETDNLQLTKRTKRLTHNAKTPGKVKGDHAGHLAGDRFGGSPDIDNLVSQSSNVNLSQYKKIENTWSRAIKKGKHVEVNVEVRYDGSSLRPSEFNVTYNIDGEYFEQIIIN